MPSLYAAASRSAVYEDHDDRHLVLLSLLLHSTNVFVVRRRLVLDVLHKTSRGSLFLATLRKENTTPFGVNLMRSQVLYRAGHTDNGTTEEDSYQDKPVWKRAHKS